MHNETMKHKRCANPVTQSQMSVPRSNIPHVVRDLATGQETILRGEGITK